MIANAYWLRHVANKYNIQGVDLRVVEGCAQQLDRWPNDLRKLIAVAGELQEGLVALDQGVRGEDYRMMGIGE